MKCTIAKVGETHRELYYGVQEHSGVEARVYELPETMIDEVRTCVLSHVQPILSHIEANFTPIQVINKK